MTDFESFTINDNHLVAIWTGNELWPGENRKGLALFDNDLWATVELLLRYFIRGQYTKEELIDRDFEWRRAFDAIESGVRPLWSNRGCSCGAHAVYGKDWGYHSPTCQINDTIYCGPFSPKNNDGRDYCFKCGQQTKQTAGWTTMHCLCINPDCSWYER